MLRRLFLLGFVGLISGHIHNYDIQADRVIGGNEALRNSYKWQVSLQIAYYDDPDYWSHICGGTLISRNWVMSAAHCVDFQGVMYRVALGEHSLSEPDGTEYFIKIKNIIAHERWNPNSIGSGYDIAMLHMSSPAYDNGFVAIAQLPANNIKLPNGFPCYVSGWGATSPYGNYPDKLQEALLPVVEHSICAQPHWWGHYATDSMVCAGGDGVKSGCSGDSGGPLNCLVDDMWQVHGVVSYGLVPYCNTYEKPTVFTRVSAYTDWIYEIFRVHGE
ncbi:chymotrypsin-like elastase family member 1 [Pleurodeles waltl]|uniref:chymotrypsin-like elastase family member 1 n=1 Tax=Pleurodeles waltl TaxID=8319 RepID=UPI003709672A